jgi:hypothetical protein
VYDEVLRIVANEYPIYYVTGRPDSHNLYESFGHIFNKWTYEIRAEHVAWFDTFKHNFKPVNGDSAQFVTGVTLVSKWEKPGQVIEGMDLATFSVMLGVPLWVLFMTRNENPVLHRVDIDSPPNPRITMISFVPQKFWIVNTEKQMTKGQRRNWEQRESTRMYTTAKRLLETTLSWSDEGWKKFLEETVATYKEPDPATLTTYNTDYDSENSEVDDEQAERLFKAINAPPLQGKPYTFKELPMPSTQPPMATVSEKPSLTIEPGLFAKVDAERAARDKQLRLGSGFVDWSAPYDEAKKRAYAAQTAAIWDDFRRTVTDPAFWRQ